MYVYGDSSYKNLDKVHSGRGYIIFLSDGIKCCCITWNANKVYRVCTSVLQAETMGLEDGLKHGEWLRAIVVETLFGMGSDPNLIRIVGMTDSDQLYKNMHSTKYVGDHALRLHTEVLKEKLRNGIISEIKHVPSELQLADALTKNGADTRLMDKVLMTGEYQFV